MSEEIQRFLWGYQGMDAFYCSVVIDRVSLFTLSGVLIHSLHDKCIDYAVQPVRGRKKPFFLDGFLTKYMRLFIRYILYCNPSYYYFGVRITILNWYQCSKEYQYWNRKWYMYTFLLIVIKHYFFRMSPVKEIRLFKIMIRTVLNLGTEISKFKGLQLVSTWVLFYWHSPFSLWFQG